MSLLIVKMSRLYPKSLISEFSKVFGLEDTERLLTVFGGMDLKIPSHEDLINMKRDFEIYEALSQTKDKAHFKIVRKTIEAKLGLKKSKIRAIFNQMKKLARKSGELKAVDKAVHAHKRPKTKSRKRKRRWMKR